MIDQTAQRDAPVVRGRRTARHIEQRCHGDDVPIRQRTVDATAFGSQPPALQPAAFPCSPERRADRRDGDEHQQRPRAPTDPFHRTCKDFGRSGAGPTRATRSAPTRRKPAATVEAKPDRRPIGPGQQRQRTAARPTRRASPPGTVNKPATGGHRRSGRRPPAVPPVPAPTQHPRKRAHIPQTAQSPPAPTRGTPSIRMRPTACRRSARPLLNRTGHRTLTDPSPPLPSNPRQAATGQPRRHASDSARAGSERSDTTE